MKKSTILLTSAIALGTLIAPLASCGKSNTPEHNVITSSVEVEIIGVDASLVNVIYDENEVKTGTLLKFKVEPTDKTIKILEVRINNSKVAEDNGYYSGYITSGENIITVKAEKEAPATCTVTTIIEGTNPDNVTMNLITDPQPGDQFTFELKAKKDVEIKEVRFNDTLIPLDPQNIYKVWARKGENIIRVKAKFVGKLQPTIGEDTVLYLDNGEQIALKKESNLNKYVSEPITLTDTVAFGVYHKEGSSYFNYGTFPQLNVYKTFASITKGHSNDEVYKDFSLQIEGGAKYKFYLDLSLDNPLYVERLEVVDLPSDKNSLKALLNNDNYNSTTNIRTDVAKAEVTAQTKLRNSNKTYKEISTFERYSDTQSLNKYEILNGKDTKQSIIYNEIKDGILYTVDTLEDLFGTNEDSDAISYRHSIAKNNKDSSKKVYTEDEAQYYVGSPNRNVGAVGNLMRTISDTGLKSSEIVKSTKTSSGFTTTYTARKVFKPSSTSSNLIARLSDGTFNFLNDGSLVSSTYKTYEFDSSKYDFDKDTLKEGVVMEDGTLIDEVTTKYTYGLNSLPTPEPEVSTYLSKYFVTSITDVIATDKRFNIEGNNLYSETHIDFHGQKDSNLDMRILYAPSTALDIQNYDVISSANTNLIGQKEGQSGFYTKHINSAETRASTDITIGNIITDGPTKTITVQVIDEIELNGLWFANPGVHYDYYVEELKANSNKGILTLGHKYSFQIGGTSKANLTGLTASASGNVLDLATSAVKNRIVTRTYGENNTLWLNIDLTLIDSDAPENKNFTTPKKLEVVFNGQLFNGELGDKGKFTFDVYSKVNKEDLYGTWTNKFVSSNGPSYNTTLTITQNEIKIDVPEAIAESEIEYPISCTHALTKNSDGSFKTWDMFEGTLGIDARVELLGSENADKWLDIMFYTFYYHPIKKQIGAILYYAESTGTDNKYENLLIGKYSEKGYDVEFLAKQPEPIK